MSALTAEGFEDISIEEENQLPLPEGWIRVIKYLGDRNRDGSVNNLTVRVYKDLSTGQESFEHPWVIKALNKARKLPLPQGWSLVRETIDGKLETFYVNPELQSSMWDPPHLRKCLAHILRQNGFESYAVAMERVKQKNDFSEEEKHIDPTKLDMNASRTFLNKTPEFESPTYTQNLIDDLPSFAESPIFQLGAHQLSALKSDTKIPDNNENNLYPLPDDDVEEDEDEEEIDQTSLTDSRRGNNYFSEGRRDEQQQQHQQLVSKQENDRNWNSLLNSFREPNNEFQEKLSHRITSVPPPMTATGINILKADLNTANERVHQLMMKLRSMLAEKEGLQCNFLYFDKDAADQHQNSNVPESFHEVNENGEEIVTMESVVTLASDIVTLIRQQPDYVIMALSHRNLVQSLEMLEIAFIVIHRLLHPFSTDNSMTTALLLQSINYQLEELSEVENLFAISDSKLIISRALLIHNAKLAITWNPMSQPFPVVPNCNREAVLSCLIRSYSLRRDVTGYFRAIWKPLLPSIASLFTSIEDLQNPLMATNMITLISRLLILTFDEKSMTIFPITATAISHAIHEIAGEEMFLTLIFNYFILPNLIKIICGDHDSLENEEIHSMKNISKTINQYYDQRWWFEGTLYHEDDEENDLESDGNQKKKKNHKQKSTQNNNNNNTKNKKEYPNNKKKIYQKTRQDYLHPEAMYSTLTQLNDGKANQENINQQSLKIISSFIFLFWKCFSAAVYLNEMQLTSLTLSELLQDHCSYLNFSSFHDQKIRNLLHRLKLKIKLGCSYLMKMPLDIQSNEYLGIHHDPHQPSSAMNLVDPYNKEAIHYNHQDTYELLDKRIAFLSFKPNEILNLTVISKQELTHLLNEILLAIERFHHIGSPTSSHPVPDNEDDEEAEEDPSQIGFAPSIDDAHPIYHLIKEFLSLYDEYDPNTHRKKQKYKQKNPLNSFRLTNNGEKMEDFLQLSFLYDNQSTLPIEDMDEEYISFEYHQLIRGLTLTNRYEDSLLNLIHKVDQNILSNIFELLADDQNQLWYLEPEFNINFKVNHIQIAEKHTTNSKNKMKIPLHGLKKQHAIKLFPLFSKFNANDEYHPDRISSAALQKEVIASYRFGSSQRGVDVGTSLARQLVLPPKISKGKVKVTTLQENNPGNAGGNNYARSEASNRSNNNRSVFTEPTVPNNASILAPTQSFLHAKLKRNREKPNYKQKDDHFMKSMREHQVIPTHEFQMRYFQRRRNRQYQQQQQLLSNNNSVASSHPDDHSPFLHRGAVDASANNNSNTNNASNKAAPKPFPEHLRNRIRPDVAGEYHEEEPEPADYYEGSGGYYGSDRGYEDGYGEEYQNSPKSKKSNRSRSKRAQQQQQGQGQGYHQHHVNQIDPNFFSSLIQDYHQTVKPLAESLVGTGDIKDHLAATANLLQAHRQQQQQQRQRSDSPTSSRVSRGGTSIRVSPRMPSPIHGDPHSVSLLSPTSSVNNRFQSIEVDGPQRNEYYRDIHEGRPPELRKYEDEEPTIHHPEPFLLTKAKKYQASGPRIPRVPDFLSPIPGEDVIYTRSRSASPTRRSRSASPASSSRSRSGSYAKPTLSGMQARSDRAVHREFVSLQQEHEQGPEHYGDGAIEELEEVQPRRDKPMALEEMAAPGPAPVLAPKPHQPAGAGQQQTKEDPSKKPAPLPAKEPVPVRRDSVQKKPPAQPAPVDPIPPAQPSITPTRRRLDSHKFSFAEALASASKEAAEQTTQAPVDSKYAFSYINDEDAANASHRHRVNLKEDREKVFEARYGRRHGRRRTAKRKAEADAEDHEEGKGEEEEEEEDSEDYYSEDDEDDLEDGKERLLEFSPQPSPGRMSRKRSTRVRINEDEQPPGPESPTRIPIIKRKSLIKDDMESKEMFLAGFCAVKHGRSGQPKKKLIKFNEEEGTLEWSNAERRSSLLGLFSSASASKVSAIEVGAIEEVKKGIHTEVLHKAGLLDPNCCLSIITEDRSLDLVFDSTSDRTKAIRGLKVILEGKNVRFS